MQSVGRAAVGGRPAAQRSHALATGLRGGQRAEQGGAGAQRTEASGTARWGGAEQGKRAARRARTSTTILSMTIGPFWVITCIIPRILNGTASCLDSLRPCPHAGQRAVSARHWAVRPPATVRARAGSGCATGSAAAAAAAAAAGSGQRGTRGAQRRTSAIVFAASM